MGWGWEGNWDRRYRTDYPSSSRKRAASTGLVHNDEGVSVVGRTGHSKRCVVLCGVELQRGQASVMSGLILAR